MRLFGLALTLLLMIPGRGWTQWGPAGCGQFDPSAWGARGQQPVQQWRQPDRQPPPPQDVSPNVPATCVNSSVRIENNLGRVVDGGSGTMVLRQDGKIVILTCFHLFREGSGQVTVWTVDGVSHPGTVLTRDKNNEDLAVVTIPDFPSATVAHVSFVAPAVGDVVYQVGFPHMVGPVTRQGRVSSIPLASRTNVPVLALSIRTQEGDSGSGVFNNQSELVGVTWGGEEQSGSAATGTAQVSDFYSRVCFKFFKGLRPGGGPSNPVQPVQPVQPVGPSAGDIAAARALLLDLQKKVGDLQADVASLQKVPPAQNGKDGKDGAPGRDGKDGQSLDPNAVAAQVVSQLSSAINQQIAAVMKTPMTCVLQDANGNVLQQVQFGFNTPLVLRLKPVTPAPAPAQP